MPDWSTQDLATIGDADEIQISTARTDGSLRSFIPIWVVRVGDDLFVRSYRGKNGSWYRHARRHPHGHIRLNGLEWDVEFTQPGTVTAETINEAYRTKYGGAGGGYVNRMLRDDVAATTLRLDPR